MNLKGKVTLLSFLACVSLISVGFSAWTIHGGDEAEVNGTIYVDGVETKTYLTQDIIREFKYNRDGYLPNDVVIEDGKIEVNSYHNIMSTYYEIDVDEYKKHFNPTKVDLEIVLTFSSEVLEYIDDLAQKAEDDIYTATYWNDFYSRMNLICSDGTNGDLYYLDKDGKKQYLMFYLDGDIIDEDEFLRGQGKVKRTLNIYDATDPNDIFEIDHLYVSYISAINQLDEIAKFFGDSLSPLLIKGCPIFEFDTSLIISVGNVTGGDE